MVNLSIAILLFSNVTNQCVTLIAFWNAVPIEFYNFERKPISHFTIRITFRSFNMVYYISNSKIQLPPNMKIQNVRGGRRMELKPIVLIAFLRIQLRFGNGSDKFFTF